MADSWLKPSVPTDCSEGIQSGEGFSAPGGPKSIIYWEQRATHNIEQIVLKILASVAAGHAPILTMVRRHLNEKPKISLVNFDKVNSRKNFTVLVHLMARTYTLLLNNQFTTKRDVYYENVSLFGNQARFDKALANLTCILEV